MVRASTRTGVPTFHPRDFPSARLPLRGFLSRVPSGDDSALVRGATARRRMRARACRVTRARDVWHVWHVWSARPIASGAPQNLDVRGAIFSAAPKGKATRGIQNVRESTTSTAELTTRATRARDSFGAASASATRLVSHRRSRRPNLARILRLTRAFASDRSGTLVCRFADYSWAHPRSPHPTARPVTRDEQQPERARRAASETALSVVLQHPRRHEPSDEPDARAGHPGRPPRFAVAAFAGPRRAQPAHGLRRRHAVAGHGHAVAGHGHDVAGHARVHAGLHHAGGRAVRVQLRPQREGEQGTQVARASLAHAEQTSQVRVRHVAAVAGLAARVAARGDGARVAARELGGVVAGPPRERRKHAR